MTTLAKHEFTVQDAFGNIITGATVTVRDESTGLIAALFANRDGSTPLGNPFTADGTTGIAAFFAAGGAYRIEVVAGAFSQTRRYVGIGTAQENDWLSFGELALVDNAAGVPFTPAGGLSSTDVQAALEELDTEKEPADSTILKEASVQNSIVIVSHKLQLSGDSASPGNSKVYGTDSGGTKGWQTPASANWVTLDSNTLSSASTLDLVLTSFTAYKILKLFLYSFVPATDAADLWLRLSTDGGSTFPTSGYRYVNNGARDGNSSGILSSSSAAQIAIATYDATRGPSNVAAEGGIDIELTFHDLPTSRWNGARWNSGWTGANQELVSETGHGKLATQQDTDAIRIMFASGAIASGKYLLAGLL